MLWCRRFPETVVTDVTVRTGSRKRLQALDTRQAKTHKVADSRMGDAKFLAAFEARGGLDEPLCRW